MDESKLGDMIRASIDGIKDFTDANAVIGNAIHTTSGTTVIPISKVTVGFANGGVDLTTAKSRPTQTYGCGGGTGIVVTPIAFLVVGADSRVELISVDRKESTAERAVSLLEQAPELISRIKAALL